MRATRRQTNDRSNQSIDCPFNINNKSNRNRCWSLVMNVGCVCFALNHIFNQNPQHSQRVRLEFALSDHCLGERSATLTPNGLKPNASYFFFLPSCHRFLMCVYVCISSPIIISGELQFRSIGPVYITPIKFGLDGTSRLKDARFVQSLRTTRLHFSCSVEPPGLVALQ